MIFLASIMLHHAETAPTHPYLIPYARVMPITSPLLIYLRPALSCTLTLSLSWWLFGILLPSHVSRGLSWKSPWVESGLLLHTSIVYDLCFPLPRSSFAPFPLSFDLGTFKPFEPFEPLECFLGSPLHSLESWARFEGNF